MIRSMAFVTAAAAALTPSIADAFELDALGAPAEAIGAERTADLVVAVPAAFSIPRPMLGDAAADLARYAAPLPGANDNPAPDAPAFEPAPPAALACSLTLEGPAGASFAVSLAAPDLVSAASRLQG